MDGAAKKTGKLRDPLEPLLTANWIALTLLALGFAAAVVAMPFGHGQLLGWGRDYICVDTSGVDAGSGSDTSWLHLHAGVGAGSTHLNLCTNHPSAGQRWWYTLANLPATATGITVVLVTYLALRQAQRQGLYTPGFAGRLRFLGWFLVADSVLWPTIQAYGSHKLWATMADSAMPAQWSPAWICLFVGLALLSLARIMRVGSAMREDLEGVV